ncbi:hypothetical protein B9Z55_008993 [Caenorhabditis nigoni]|nr:hypothetical protein B9Z55_008993 [Caenorhabditis nigoni]
MSRRKPCSSPNSVRQRLSRCEKGEKIRMSHDSSIHLPCSCAMGPFDNAEQLERANMIEYNLIFLYFLTLENKF